ncbi:12446_t:CDS:2 [Entrophospora sp. SA101]|nr:12446_t:CDS:2 [Entrophospora sp. SA101]
MNTENQIVSFKNAIIIEEEDDERITLVDDDLLAPSSMKFKIFENDPGKELTIKEIVKNDLAIPPLGYIRKIIDQINDYIGKDGKKEKKRNQMFIKILSFGIAKFCDLNKIINLHTAMLFQTNFINLINWVDNLCTLANQNYVNDMVIESVLRIFKAFKDDDNKNNNFILAPIYLYTCISDGKFDIAYNLLAPIDLITNINRLFEFYGTSFEDEVYYIGEIPYQCGILDCGITILIILKKKLE